MTLLLVIWLLQDFVQLLLMGICMVPDVFLLTAQRFCRLFYLVIIDDTFNITSIIKNSDYTYYMLFIVYKIINSKIVHRNPMHFHTLPWFPLHINISCRHKI